MIIEEKPGKNQNTNWWAERTKKLLFDQKEKWSVLKSNYENLSNIELKEIRFDNYKVLLQFNPGRILSVTLDTESPMFDTQSCQICQANLPSEQDVLVYDKNFFIHCNPIPIFNEHFTISRKKHKQQNIIGNFGDMLNLSKDLGEYYTLLYNGPKCGSSAPAHMHFQAGTKLIMPIENEISFLANNYSKTELRSNKIVVKFIEDYLRYAIMFESDIKAELVFAFKIFVKAFKKISSLDEPMMNIITTYDGTKWNVFIFPRAKHRPKQFYLNDNKKILLSPAAVDLGGLIVVPREEDFEKITSKEICDIFKQVTLTKEYFEYLKKKIGEAF